MKDALLENSVLRVRLHYQRLVKYFIKLIVNLTVLSPIVLITPNNMLTISSNKIFRLDFCYNTAIPHKYSQNINFFFFFFFLQILCLMRLYYKVRENTPLFPSGFTWTALSTQPTSLLFLYSHFLCLCQFI